MATDGRRNCAVNSVSRMTTDLERRNGTDSLQLRKLCENLSGQGHGELPFDRLWILLLLFQSSLPLTYP